VHKPNPPESPQCARIILASQPAPAATTLEVAVAAVTDNDRHKGKTNADQIPTLPALRTLGNLADVRPVIVVDSRHPLPLLFVTSEQQIECGRQKTSYISTNASPVPLFTPLTWTGPLAAVISTSYHVQLFSGSATVTVKFEFSAPAMGTPLRRHWYEVAPVAETVRLSVPPSGTTCRGEVMLVITGSVCAAPMTDRATKKTTSVKILIGNMV